jgi:hypothetical protein
MDASLGTKSAASVLAQNLAKHFSLHPLVRD